MGLFVRMMEGLSSEGPEQKTVIIDATYLKAHRTASSLRTKNGDRRSARASDRAHERRVGHQVAHRHRRERLSAAVLHDDWPSQRPHWRGGTAGQPARRQMADRRSGIRRGPVPGCVERQGNKAMHRRPEMTQQSCRLRQAPLRTAQSHRDHVPQAQRLVPRRYKLRQTYEDLPLRHCTRRNHHLQASRINSSGAYILFALEMPPSMVSTVPEM